jgi:hypothetical protein
MCGNDKNRPTPIWPFFAGVWHGAVGRPPYLVSGAVRTYTWLGLRGADAQQSVHLHNHLTLQAIRYGFRYVRHPDVNAQALISIWRQLPQDAQENTINWAAQAAGGVLGGSVVAHLISKRLAKVFPSKIVVPSIFFLSFQGFLASMWKDMWGGGPPPPPPPGGASGGIKA